MPPPISLDAWQSRGDISSGVGGAIYSNSAHIRNCVLEDNSAGGLGGFGGAVADFGTLTIEGCSFTGNVVGANHDEGSGGALFLASGTVRDCVFVDNTAQGPVSRGGAIYASETASIEGCLFIGNQSVSGGAVWMTGSIERCTFLANVSTVGGGAAIVAIQGTVRRVILSGNTGYTTCGGGATWECSNLFANAGGDVPCGVDGGGNFSADPQFCAVDPATSSNVSLQEDSPCAPGNHPTGDTCDLIGYGTVACGAVAVHPVTWSACKIFYR